VTVGSTPAVPTISQSGLVLTSSSASGNQWYLNGSPIAGATGQTYTVTTTGYYSVWITSPFGCQSSSAVSSVILSGINELHIFNAIILGPNPAKNQITLTIPSELLNAVAEIKVVDVSGKVAIEKQLLLNAMTEKINIENLAKGIYVLELKTNTIDKKFKFVKE
jgi:hypothetical protein